MTFENIFTYFKMLSDIEKNSNSTFISLLLPHPACPEHAFLSCQFIFIDRNVLKLLAAKGHITLHTFAKIGGYCVTLLSFKYLIQALSLLEIWPKLLNARPVFLFDSVNVQNIAILIQIISSIRFNTFCSAVRNIV